jgi:glycosyltransferase involved in cell wall biosynthesis
MNVSVVVPVYNGAATLEACLRSLQEQSLARSEYEVLVVDDGSTDASAIIARRFGARVLQQPNAGAPAARNTGMLAARGRWIAFTDADCVVSRNWLTALLAAVCARQDCLGAAGKTVGFSSQTAAARFVDLMGGLDAQRYLQHPVYPFAPTANVLYRRDCLLAIHGFDARYATYDACDLHTRLMRKFQGAFVYEPRALVLHRHRPSWPAYWRQQFYYGVGYAQFMLARRREVRWSAAHQLRAACDVVAKAAMAMLPARGDDAIVRRGLVIRAAAQQAGFLRTYYNPAERRKW